MKKCIPFLLFMAFNCVSYLLNGAVYKAEKEKIITQQVYDDLYLAAEVITVNAKIEGDLTAAGEKITINDTVMEDLIVAGKDILLNSYIGDDVKLLGQHIKVLKNVRGDLIICGASIHINKEVIIEGDLIIFGESIQVDGTVNGQIKLFGNEVIFNGTVRDKAIIKAYELSLDGLFIAPASLAANTISLNRNVQFHDSVKYWQKEGELNLMEHANEYLVNFDSDLALYEDEFDWENISIGIFSFSLLYLLSVILTIVLFVWLFRKPFIRAGLSFNYSPAQNFGYGALYLLATPLIALFFLITIVGIPIGLLLLAFYFFSLVFAQSITAIIIAESFNASSRKDWSKIRLIVIAVLFFFAMKLVMLIPIVGILIIIITVGTSFGALINSYLHHNNLPKNRTA